MIERTLHRRIFVVPGYVSGLDALTCAKVSCLLGAGRTKAGQPLDHAVGLDLHIEVGSHVIKG